MKKLIYISLISFLLLACTKGGGNMYVEGRAYNPATGEGLKNIKIQLWKEQPSSGYIGPSTSKKFVETTYTDADGNYKIKHTGVFQAFYLEVTDYGENYPIGWVDISTKKKNYANVIAINSVKMIKSKNMHADFQAVPYGYLKLSIHNVNCQGGGDSMRFRFQTIGESDFESWSNYRTGCYMYDDPGGGAKVPMGWRVYQWEVTRNGSVNYYTDSVFVPNNNSTTFTINY